MNVNELIQAITTIGFPIVACIAMAIFYNKINDNYRTDIQRLESEHKAEVKAMTEALNNNTMALQRLIDKIGDD